jgi:hypothetical protein
MKRTAAVVVALFASIAVHAQSTDPCRLTTDGGYSVVAFTTADEARDYVRNLPESQGRTARIVPSDVSVLVLTNRCDGLLRASNAEQVRRRAAAASQTIPGVDIDSDGIRLQYLTTNGYGLYDGDRRVAFMWCDRESLYLFMNATALMIHSMGGGTLDFNGTAMQINGTKVVGVQGDPVANADGTLDSVTKQLNELLSRLRDHGLIGR